MKNSRFIGKIYLASIFLAITFTFAANVKAVCTIGSNLILNGDAEANQDFSGGGFTDHDVSNWDLETNTFTVVRYTAGGGFPTVSTPGPASRGNFFFSGGPGGGLLSSGTQIINVTDCGANIDNGIQTYDLSGFFGGFGSQPDTSILTITFKNSANVSIGSATIGNVTASDRGQATALLARNTTGLLPSGTRTIEVVLSMPPAGGYNDGYADNLSVILGITGTWDGGGATNNWSEAANWTGDILPNNSMPVTFNGTSNKDVVFDIPLTRTAETNINAGYTGTLSAGSTNLTFNGAFIQSGGTFNGGNGTLDFNGNITLSGGTFTQSSNLNLFSSFNFSVDSAVVFNHNNGTFVIDGPFNFIGTATSLELFNIRVQATHNLGSKTMIANETLEMISGNRVDGSFETRNNLTIATNYSATSSVIISGNNTRTITLPVTAAMPRFIINAPNVTIQPSSTSGTLTFANIGFALQNGTFNANGANLIFSVPTAVSGGTFNGGSGSMTFTSGGTLTLTGGIFNATSGTLTYNPFSSNITTDATFNPNGGTFVVNAPTNFNGNAATMNFHNLTTLANFGMGTRIFNVAGTLNLSTSSGGNGTIQAAGDVVVGSGFTGGSGLIQFVGSGNQTYTNNGGVNPTGIWTLNKTGGTVNLATNLNLSNAVTNFVLTNGTITTGANTVIAGTRNIIRTSGFINGSLRRTFTAASSRTFDVGTINGYAPVTINATAGTFGASTTFTVGGKDGTLNGANPDNSLTRNWTLEPSAGGISQANIRFDYQQSDVPATANEANFAFLRRSGLSTIGFTPTTIDTTNNFFTLNDVAVFSDWSLGVLNTTAASANIGGRVLDDAGRGISLARLTLTDLNGNTRSAMTNPFGFYRFDAVEVGETYIISAAHKSYQFANPTQTVFVSGNLSDIDFTALNQAAANSSLEIGGQVKNAKGLGLANVEIEISGASLKKPRIVKSDENGFYRFEDLAFGETYFLNINSKIHSFREPLRIITLTENLTAADFVADSN